MRFGIGAGKSGRLGGVVQALEVETKGLTPGGKIFGEDPDDFVEGKRVGLAHTPVLLVRVDVGLPQYTHPERLKGRAKALFTAVDHHPIAASVGCRGQLGVPCHPPRFAREGTHRLDLVEHAMVVAHQCGIGHALGVTAGRLIGTVGPVAKTSALHIVHPPDRGRLPDRPAIEEPRPEQGAQQPHGSIGPVAPFEDGVVGMRRPALLYPHHQVDVKRVGNDDLGAVEGLGGLGHPGMREEEIRTRHMEIGVNPIVLEPESPSRH